LARWDTGTGCGWAAAPGAGWHAAPSALAPDGTALAVAVGDATVTLWDVATGARRADLPAHAGAVRALAFSRRGATLATADDAGIRLGEARTGGPGPGPRLGAPGVRCLAFAPPGGVLAAGGTDGTVGVWDLAAGRPRLAIRAHAGPLRALEFAGDGSV